jgi:D-amino peptidase
MSSQVVLFKKIIRLREKIYYRGLCCVKGGPVHRKTERVIIIADIEGSSRCWNYRGSSFLTGEWAEACAGMTEDIASVATALVNAGVKDIMIKDFHRTGYNLLKEKIDPRARVVSGYKRGPVPGLGDPGNSKGLLCIGMHASSGSGGFLAHTLTSRIGKLLVNGKPMSEVALFSASLAGHGIRPLFFSGCPVACGEAQEAVRGIDTYAIDKSMGPDNFDAASWREGLCAAAVASLENRTTVPYVPEGPFNAAVTMRDGAAAAHKVARRWDMPWEDDTVFISAADFEELYYALIRICYLTPFIERILPIGLPVYNLAGRMGLWWVRRKMSVTFT